METTAIPIEQVNRKELKARIPHGGIKEIKEKTGYSTKWIRDVLNGYSDNADILQAAYDLFWDAKKTISINKDHEHELTTAA
ncbi:MAG: hypothetical protein ABJI69_09160 [Balneola sp.]